MTRRGIVVTGASAGIGRALARYYAAPGTALALIGRHALDLAETADVCRARGAVVEVIALDIRERDPVRDWLGRFEAAHPVGLVLANAGVALSEDGSDRDATTYEVIDINLVGALNTVLPLLPAMTARGSGQVAFVSSIAAFSPLPDAPAYSASKAALLAYGRALRAKLRPTGVKVSVACPGFVATRMGVRYAGWRPLEMSAEAAASRIAAGLARDQAVIAFPRRLAAMARLGALVPEPVLRRAMDAFRFSIERGG